MKRLFKWIALLVLVLVLLLGAFIAHTWYFKPATIGLFYGRVFLKFALDDPELLSQLRVLESLGLHFHNDELSDMSPARDDRLAAQIKSDLDTLHAYDRDGLDLQGKLSYDVMDQFLTTMVALDAWRLYGYPLNQMQGVQKSWPQFMTDTHQVTSVGEASDYIARLKKLPWKFDGLLQDLAMRQQAGIIPPRFVIEKVLAEMRGFIGMPAEQNVLYSEFALKLDKLGADQLSDPRKRQLLTETTAAINEAVYPAYQKLIAHYDQLLPLATGNNGVWALPKGDAFYALKVKEHTTTDLTPEQVHQIGLDEVARIGAQMDTILRGAGLSEGTLGARVQELGKRPEQQYPDSDAGRAQILADYQTIIDEMDAGTDKVFSVRPQSKVAVKRVPEYAEKTAPGAYYNPPALDGSRPGTFYANLRDVSEIPRFGMRTLAYHEAIPGHHFQLGVAQELKGLPFFRTILPFTAYSEGWALYAEQLAWEMGFEADPLDNLGRLQAEMFRAVRLVVDTGMHRMKWTREQAIGYMRDNTGMGEVEVTAEIERYLVNPGQALAYKIGMLKILELRAAVQAKLGDRYDPKAFHQQILGNGALPMNLLERTVNEWLATQ